MAFKSLQEKTLKQFLQERNAEETLKAKAHPFIITAPPTNHNDGSPNQLSNSKYYITNKLSL